MGMLGKGVPLIILSVVLALGCNRGKESAPPDHPRLTPKVAMRDVVFRSAALGRDMQYRVVTPASIQRVQNYLSFTCSTEVVGAFEIGPTTLMSRALPSGG